MDTVVVGEGSLALACSERLRDRGHDLRAVLSDDDGFIAWANQHGIALLESGRELAARFAPGAYDWLFSIANPRILSPAILAQARSWAINYHDAPLPRYAGTHATSWALVYGETRHAISWHVITDRIDGGDILAQVWLDVEPEETAMSLNLKCYDAALAAFAALLGQLERGEVQRVAQEAAKRTYFGLTRRPEAASTLCFEKSAKELERLVRALSFGDYANPLGAPKIYLGDGGYVIVTEARARATPPARAEPGRVIHAADDVVEVATRDGILAVSAVVDIEGSPLPLATLAAQPMLPALAADERRRAAALDAAARPHERYWRRRLTDLRLIAPPEEAPDDGSHDLEVGSLELDGRGADEFDVLTLAALFLLQATGATVGDVWLHDERLHREPRPVDQLLADAVPLRLELREGDSLATLRARLAAEIAALRERGPFLRDMLARYPELAGIRGLSGRLVLRLGTSTDWVTDDAVLVIDGPRFGWTLGKASRLSRAFVASFAAFVQALAPLEARWQAPLAELEHASRLYLAPRNWLERLLCDAWSATLGVAVGPLDDVFGLGAHTIAFVEMARVIRERLDITIPPRRLFRASTVRELVVLVAEAQLASVSEADRQRAEAALAEACGLSLDEVRSELDS
jgi:methionyl-tRNA formyltransferase